MRALKSAALAVLILAGCSSDSDDASESESGATVVVGAPIAASATYTGEACPYDGPNEVTVGATLSITVVNRTTEPEIGFSLWQVPDGTTAEEIAEGGISEIVGTDDQAHDVVFAPTDQDTEYELSAVVDVAGTWVVNCFFLGDGGDVEYPTVITVSEQ